MNFNKVKFSFFHQKLMRRIESLQYRLKKSVLNIEIFDLFRQISTLQKRLVHSSLFLSELLPFYFIKNILFQLFYAPKTKNRHSKKLNWLLKKKNRFLLRTIRPISFLCLMNDKGCITEITPTKLDRPVVSGIVTLIEHLLNTDDLNILHCTNKNSF